MKSLSAIFASRKGIAAVVVTMFVVLLFGAECVAAALGRMTFVDLKGEATTFEALLAGVWGLFILGTAHEDAATKSNPMAPPPASSGSSSP